MFCTKTSFDTEAKTIYNSVKELEVFITHTTVRTEELLFERKKTMYQK